MKRIAIILCTTFVVVSAFVYQNYFRPGNRVMIAFKPGIHQTIASPDRVSTVWTMAEKDSVVANPQTGNSSINIPLGSRKFYIEATYPYKDAVLENVRVKEG